MRWLIVLLLTLAASAVKAEDQFSFHGFAMGTYDSAANPVSPHMRLIFQEKLSPSFDLNLSVTPIGPPIRFFTYYDLTWRKPAACCCILCRTAAKSI